MYGEHSWATVAAALGCEHNGKQCRARFMAIRPGISRGPWTDADEAQLMVRAARALR